MAGQLHSSRLYLKTFSMQIVERYLDYLLGPFAMGLVSDGGEGVATTGWMWQQLLIYEREIRKTTMTLVLSGRPLEEALVVAWNDSVTKNRYYLDPFR